MPFSFGQNAGAGGEGGGLVLGPTPNEFNAATRAAAETARDAGITDTSSYDDNPSLAIILSWPTTPTNTVYQARRSGSWADVTPVVRGPGGSDGRSVFVGYSADNSSWHAAVQTGDRYIRFYRGLSRPAESSSSWTAGIRFVGRDGTDGVDATIPPEPTETEAQATSGDGITRLFSWTIARLRTVIDTYVTGPFVKGLLEALTGTARLNASAIQNLPTTGENPFVPSKSNLFAAVMAILHPSDQAGVTADNQNNEIDFDIPDLPDRPTADGDYRLNIASGVATWVVAPAGGNTPAVPMHTRYYGWSTDRVIESSDLNGALTRVATDTDDTGMIPANAANAYGFIAVPASRIPNAIYVGTNVNNQIGGWTRQANNVDDGANEAHAVFVTNFQLPPSTTGRAIRLGYAS